MNEESILAVTGSVAQPSAFGTGFIVYQDESVTYWVTCAHVIEDVGGEEGVKVDGQPAKVVAIGKSSGNDLAVLAVESGLSDKQPLPLANSGKKGDRFTTYGYRLSVTSRVSRELQGTLGKSGQIAIGQGGRLIRAWDLEVTDTDPLEKGYSGSPVFDDSGHVIAVVSQRQNDGRKGQAIAIAALKEIWTDMPLDLLKSSPSQVPSTLNQIIALIPSAEWLAKVFSSSLFVAMPIVAMRFLGFLQPAELWAYDQLFRLKPSNFQDNRLLIVAITEDDVSKWRGQATQGASIPDPVLAELLTKLEKFEPKAIGLDIYRDFSAQDPNLAEILTENEDLFVVCKVPDESSSNSGVKPPPEVPPERQGFSDFVEDEDLTLRRYLFKLDLPLTSPCNASYALSFQLAIKYLQAKPVNPTGHDYWVDGVRFKPLSARTGGYQFLDDGGYQILLNYSSAAIAESSAAIAESVPLDYILNLDDEALRRYAEERNLIGRIILIGVTDPNVQDDWTTPLGNMRGLMAHAQMVSQILRVVEDGEPLIWVWNPGMESLWILGWASVGGILGLGLRSRRNFIIAISTATLSLWVVCFFVFYGNSGWLPSVPPTLSLVLAGVWIRNPLTKKIN